jgi:hypothetical protein
MWSLSVFLRRDDVSDRAHAIEPRCAAFCASKGVSIIETTNEQTPSSCVVLVCRFLTRCGRMFLRKVLHVVVQRPDRRIPQRTDDQSTETTSNFAWCLPHFLGWRVDLWMMKHRSCDALNTTIARRVSVDCSKQHRLMCVTCQRRHANRQSLAN